MSRGARGRAAAATAHIWPGFVDALATLLLVIVFVVLALAASQVFLAQAVDDRDAALADRAAELDARAAEIAAQQDALATQGAALAQLDARVAALAEALNIAEAENADLDSVRRRLLADLADLQRDRNALAAERDAVLADRDAVSAERDAILDDRDAQAAARAAAEDARAAAQADRLAADAARRGALNALAGATGLSADDALAAIAQNLRTLQAETARLNEALDAADAAVAQKNVEILSLGERLNRALADKVAELRRYSSAFFGRLREILGDRDDVRIAGDRFVFQAEVLFAPGSDALGPAGEAAIDALAASIAPLIGDIPAELDWYLRVDGHTDDEPIANARFASNWALSASRALSVVNRLIAAGLPPQRLAAAGFGEFQPAAENATAEGRARNRRIEIVLDQRPPAERDVTPPAIP